MDRGDGSQVRTDRRSQVYALSRWSFQYVSRTATKCLFHKLVLTRCLAVVCVSLVECAHLPLALSASREEINLCVTMAFHSDASEIGFSWCLRVSFVTGIRCIYLLEDSHYTSHHMGLHRPAMMLTVLWVL